jgi:hypothetical protein
MAVLAWYQHVNKKWRGPQPPFLVKWFSNVSGFHLKYRITVPAMLFYFLFYTDGDLSTFTLLFYVVLFLVLYWWCKCPEININIKQEIKQHKTVK